MKACRFTHLVSSPDYKTMPARLRMSVIAGPGVDALDFELWSLAVSAINGCRACVDAHEREVAKKGAGKEAAGRRPHRQRPARGRRRARNRGRRRGRGLTALS